MKGRKVEVHKSDTGKYSTSHRLKVREKQLRVTTKVDKERENHSLNTFVTALSQLVTKKTPTFFCLFHVFFLSHVAILESKCNIFFHLISWWRHRLRFDALKKNSTVVSRISSNKITGTWLMESLKYRTCALICII